MRISLLFLDHILDPDFAGRNPAQHESIHNNGQRRLATAHALLAADVGPDQILCNRAVTGPICQRGEDDLHTDFAVVFSPMEKTLHLWPGYPDEVVVETLAVSKSRYTW